MTKGNCFPYLDQVTIAVLELLTLHVAKGQSLHVIFSKRRNTSQGILGGRQVGDTVQKQTCRSLLSILWFRVLNLRR
jgi:hypothetical protein